MLDFLTSRVRSKEEEDPRSANAKAWGLQEGKPVQMRYASRDVPLPADFLSPGVYPDEPQPQPQPQPPSFGAEPRGPLTVSPIDWASTVLPENAGRFAVVLDNVLSPGECATLIELAGSTVDIVSCRVGDTYLDKGGDDAGGGGADGHGHGHGHGHGPGPGPGHDPWMPALVNAGGRWEVLDSSYRNSDRIVWDCQEIVDRVWARCMQGEAGEMLRKKLDVLDGDVNVTGPVRGGKKWRVKKQRWAFSRLNNRMRFLRYGEGQFFRPHCDGPYSEEVDGKIFKTFFTLHLYLNDSVAEAGQEAELVGGATSFISNDGTRKMDVDPRAGRVLIFQHRLLYHAGDDVLKGVKYTMRTDIMYELESEQPEGEEGAEID